MPKSQEEKDEDTARRVADKWLIKYRDRKLRHMERARQNHENDGLAIGGGAGASRDSSRSSRLTSTFSSSSGGAADANASESRKMHIMQAKLKQKLIKQKQKDKAERRKLVKKQERLQAELEYVNFPTIMGWYFDGFFTQPFALNEKFATTFNELEEGIARKKEMSYKETFTEKTRRNFWPPPLIISNCFRTRGVYMDLFETKKDPPHTPPQIDFEHITPGGGGGGGMQMFMDPNSPNFYDENKAKLSSSKVKIRVSNTSVKQPYMRFNKMGSRKMSEDEDEDEEEEEEEEEEDDDDDIAIPRVMRYGRRKKYNKQPVRSKMFYRIREEEYQKRNKDKKTDFYFDDEKAGFYKKKARFREMYYYDVKYEVWRIKRKPRTFATDFYFDSVAGAYFPKDRNRKETDYIFDGSFFCYKLDGQSGPPKNGLTPDDYAFDEMTGKWRRIDNMNSEDKKSVVVDYNGSRFAIKGQDLTPDDYFFDADAGKFELKTGADHDHEKYHYDDILGVWVLTSPKPKGPEQQDKKSKISPSFYFWDENKFCYRRKNGPSAYFIYDANNKFFRMKKSIMGKYNPKNWRWDEKKKIWYLYKNPKSGGYFSEELHWRPDRDYDKPWLEYIEGYTYTKGGSFDNDDNITSQPTNAKDGPTTSAASTTATSAASSTAGLGGQAKSGGQAGAAGQAGAGGKSTTAGGKEAEAPAPSPVSVRKIPKAAPVELKISQESLGPQKSKLEKALEAHDLFDPRVLKVSNLGFIVTEVDLRAYFPSVIKVLRPKLFNSDVYEDFALLYFLTDEAASAALRTMNKQKIKGVVVFVTYCKKTDKKVYEQRIDVQNAATKAKRFD